MSQTDAVGLTFMFTKYEAEAVLSLSYFSRLTTPRNVTKPFIFLVERALFCTNNIINIRRNHDILYCSYPSDGGGTELTWSRSLTEPSVLY